MKSDGALHVLQLRSQSVAAFYREVMNALDELQLAVQINHLPNEVENAIPFEQDETHRTYDPAQANRFWRVLLQSDRVLKKFRSRFCGKCSPVHFFWGSFDSPYPDFRARGATHPGGIPPCPTRSPAKPTLRKWQRRLLAGEQASPSHSLFLRLSRRRMRGGKSAAAEAIYTRPPRVCLPSQPHRRFPDECCSNRTSVSTRRRTGEMGPPRSKK